MLNSRYRETLATILSLDEHFTRTTLKVNGRTGSRTQIRNGMSVIATASSTQITKPSIYRSKTSRVSIRWLCLCIKQTQTQSNCILILYFEYI